MMRLVYALAEIAVQQNDIGIVDCRALGSLVSLMIQQYNVLSSYQVTKDLVKIILITSLPKFHEIIAFLDPETFEKELVSEAPSALSLTLFDCIVRYKRFSSHSVPENKVFIDWICESLLLCVPSAAIASSLCVVLYGGVQDDDNIPGQQDCIYDESCVWWKKDWIHQLIENFPPGAFQRTMLNSYLALLTFYFDALKSNHGLFSACAMQTLSSKALDREHITSEAVLI